MAPVPNRVSCDRFLGEKLFRTASASFSMVGNCIKGKGTLVRVRKCSTYLL